MGENTGKLAELCSQKNQGIIWAWEFGAEMSWVTFLIPHFQDWMHWR